MSKEQISDAYISINNVVNLLRSINDLVPVGDPVYSVVNAVNKDAINQLSQLERQLMKLEINKVG